MIGTASNPAIDQAHIVKLNEHWANAIRTRDLGALMETYSKNVMLFDVIEPLEYQGIDAVSRRAEEWFSSFQGPFDFETHDVRIATDSDVAFSHSLNHVRGAKTDGQQIDMWWRSTICYRKIDDKWMVTHEHNSVPINGATGRASLDLKPELKPSPIESGTVGSDVSGR